MAMYAYECVNKMNQLVKDMEVSLGKSLCELLA